MRLTRAPFGLLHTRQAAASDTSPKLERSMLLNLSAHVEKMD